MKLSFSFIPLIIVMMTTVDAWGGEKIHQVIDVPETGFVYVENTRGEVKIIGWDKPQVKVEGELDDSAKKIVIKSKGEKTLIKVVMNPGHYNGNETELVVHVPSNVAVHFKGVDTSFDIKNINQGVEGHTVNGDLKLVNNHLFTNVSTVSGKVKVVDSSGDADIESVSGGVKFDGKYNAVKIKSMSGDIIANISQIMNLVIDTVSGNTTVSGGLQNNAHVELISVSGNILYQVNGELNANCEVASLFGGKINNNFTEDQPWSDKMTKRKLHFISGDGSGKLLMHTVSGAVTIDK